LSQQQQQTKALAHSRRVVGWLVVPRGLPWVLFDIRVRIEAHCWLLLMLLPDFAALKRYSS
jgi:hypothetical protein